MSASLDPTPRSDECDVSMLSFLMDKEAGIIFALFTTNAGIGGLHKEMPVWQQQIYAWSAAHGV